MKICTNLPEEVHSFCYVKNHHWIELQDKAGHKLKLNDNGLMRYECVGCDFYCYTPSNRGKLHCPACNTEMKQAWQRLQVCFVPDVESDFTMKKKV